MEDETTLAGELEKCGLTVPLRCTNCGSPSYGESRCKRRWCPVCQIAIAAERSKKIEQLVAAMQWPLFITLTKSNDDDMNYDGTRHLMTSFGKLRRKKIWRDQVKGGAACVEITNIGHGWHPHLHAIVDCRWLAIRTKEPPPNCSREAFQLHCKMAQQELAAEWAKCLDQRVAIVWACRARKDTIAKEVAKYSVKGSDLIACEGKIGPLLKGMKHARLLRTFGTCFRFPFADQPHPHPKACSDCGECATMLPEQVYNWQYGVGRS